MQMKTKQYIRKNPTLCVVIPAYNEEATIAATITDFHEHAPDADILIVNNASTDNTGEIAQRTLTERNIRGGVILEPNKGKGNALRSAFAKVDTDIVIMVDADTTYPAKHLNELIAPIKAGEAEMVVGDRLSHGRYDSENKRALHSFGNRLVRDLINKLFNANLSDIMSGYRAFSRKFIRTYPILVDGFEIETDMTLHALDKRLAVREIAVEYRDRPVGSFSKLNTFADGWRVLTTIGNIVRHYKPFMFFGALSLFALILCICAGLPVISDWINYRYIYRVPLAILAAGLGICSVLFVAIGLILDSIRHISRAECERFIQNFTDD
jgi:glycosyltransferase involved in cell wall biosynthesis